MRWLRCCAPPYAKPQAPHDLRPGLCDNRLYRGVVDDRTCDPMNNNLALWILAMGAIVTVLAAIRAERDMRRIRADIAAMREEIRRNRG